MPGEPAGNGGSPDFEGMFGQPSGKDAAPSKGNPAEAIAMQFRSLVSTVEDIARQFPETAPDAKTAKDALVRMMVSASGQAKGPESHAPRVAR